MTFNHIIKEFIFQFWHNQIMISIVSSHHSGTLFIFNIITSKSDSAESRNRSISNFCTNFWRIRKMVYAILFFRRLPNRIFPSTSLLIIFYSIFSKICLFHFVNIVRIIIPMPIPAPTAYNRE